MSVYNRSSRYERILRKKKKILRRRRRLSAAVMASAAMLAGMFFFIQSSISGEKGNIGGEKNADAALSGAGAAVDSNDAGTADSGEWNLILVNPWHEIPEDYEVELTELKNGQAVDSRCYPELQQMMDDCRADGLNPVICASYRTMEKQQALFNDKKRRVIREGCPASSADEEAAKTVARPGTSEHQLGLALDIVDLDYQQLDTRQEETPVQKWLMENSWKYGFILRYPTDKSNITGIIYEPWHYRYVGKEAAKVIHEKGICLEEYLENDPEES